ncbi:F-box domain, partial [Arabidopsis suecica]
IMRRRSKKSKTENNKDLQTSEERIKFDEIPHDLVIEILGRFPAKSVARFLTVSKLWATTIRSPDFIKSYPFGSSSKPRTLIACDLNYKEPNPNVHFFRPSTSSSSTSTSLLSRVTCPFTYPRHMEYYYHHVNGLISVGYGTEQIVTNPITGKFITLPKPRTRRKLVRSLFGYDSVSDQYKVLCMTERLRGHPEEASSQHQVYTLGAKKKSWKMINCSIPHRPWSWNGVCINGVVYYIAKTGEGMLHLSIMRFDLKSDDLDLFTSLPEEIETSLYDCLLINYEGKVAIPTRPTDNTCDVWVMNQEGGKLEWLKKISFSIKPNWKGSCYLVVTGTTPTGEFILAPTHYYDSFYVFHYNPDLNSFRKITIQAPGVPKYNYHQKLAFVFWDYIYVFHYHPHKNSFRRTKVEASSAFMYRSRRAMVFPDYVESVRLL